MEAPTLERFIKNFLRGKSVEIMSCSDFLEEERFSVPRILSHDQMVELVKMFYGDCFDFTNGAQNHDVSLWMQPKNNYRYREEVVIVSVSIRAVAGVGWIVSVLK